MECQNRNHAPVPRSVRSAIDNSKCSVYGVRTGVTWWFTRKIEREMHQKEVLKTRLDEKIEELKEKSDYYNTQQLLERYDSKALPRSTSDEKFHDPAQSQSPQLKSSSEGIRRQPSIDTLRQRGNSRALLPQLPPPITPASFVSPKPQNIPQFHPSAFSPPPSPSLAPQELRSKTFLDRVLDLLVGEDENAADHRYALICRHCRAHNGLAPPGERGEDVGYLCGRCGGWNGPDPNKKEQSTPKDEESQAKDGQAEDREEAVDNLIQNKEKDKGNGKDIEQHGANLSA